MGAFEDFTKSAMRYLKNNYFDGIRQDGFDLMTGNFIPRRGPNALRALIVDNRPLLIRAVGFTPRPSLAQVLTIS
jgi:phosphatidylinositol 4-phosphatase